MIVPVEFDYDEMEEDDFWVGNVSEHRINGNNRALQIFKIKSHGYVNQRRVT